MGAGGAISQAATGVISAGSTVAGGVLQSKALKQQAFYEQQIAGFNARIADMKEREAYANAEKDVNKVRRAKRQIIGSQRAAAAAQGIDIASGSALEIQQDTEIQAEEDVKEIRANAWKEAFGYKLEALQYRHKGAASALARKHQAKRTLIDSGLSAFNTLYETAFSATSGMGGGGGKKSGGGSSGSKTASPFTTGMIPG